MSNLQEQIERRLHSLYSEETSLKTRKNMLKERLLNDEELVALNDKVETAKKSLSLQREMILNEPDNRKLKEDLKDVRQSIKDLKELLSGELLGYYTENNTLEFIDTKGGIHRILVNAKLKKSDQPSMF